MKLEIRLEAGEPIIFFLDDVDKRKQIACWNVKESHNVASRGYMRSLELPVTQAQQSKVWATLAIYARVVKAL